MKVFFKNIIIALVILATSTSWLCAQEGNNWQVQVPSVVMKGVNSTFTIGFEAFVNDTVSIQVNGKSQLFRVNNQQVVIDTVLNAKTVLHFKQGNHVFLKPVKPAPLWLSLLPSLIAIATALIFKEVFSALFLGIFSGAFIRFFYADQSVLSGIGNGLKSVVDSYVPRAMMDEGHVSIIVFSMLIGGVVNLINKNGGMNGFVNKLSALARSARSTQMVTWFLGLFIFFDDYANTMVVGNTMRPVTDKWRVSREKLAYIVDSTAAPIAAIAFVTTWIGAELSYISEGLETIGLNESPYSVFIHSLKYSFYPILTIIFVAMLIWQKREFGPMRQAELLVKKKGISSIHPQSNSNKKQSTSGWYNGVVPVVIIISGTLAGLIYTGWDGAVWNNAAMSTAQKVSFVIGNADSYKAMLWSSLAATLVAIAMTSMQKLANLQQIMEYLLDGYKSMLQAVMVLVLAWALATINDELHTAEFISKALIDFEFAVWIIPAITFVLALSVSFATGSAWGTMAILYPLVIPASWLIAQATHHDVQASLPILYNVVSCVLAGSVLGDHISPISDTTIMSSLASSCNHIAHVRTQIPYALTVGLVSLVAGTIPATLGMPPLLAYFIAIPILFMIIRFVGKRV